MAYNDCNHELSPNNEHNTVGDLVF